MFHRILRKVLENDNLSVENLDILFNKAFTELGCLDNQFYLEKNPFENLEMNRFLDDNILEDLNSKLKSVSQARSQLIASTSISSPFPNYNVLDKYLRSYYELLRYIIFFYSSEKCELLSKSSLETLLSLEKKNNQILLYAPQFLMLYKICFEVLPHYLNLIKSNPEEKEIYKNILLTKMEKIDFSLISVNKSLYKCKLNEESLHLDIVPYLSSSAKIDTCMIIIDILNKIEEKMKSSPQTLINILVLGEFDKKDIPLLDKLLHYLSLKYKQKIKVNLTLSNTFNENNIVYDTEFLKVIETHYDNELSTPDSIQQLDSKYDMLFILNFFDLYKKGYSETTNLSAYNQQIRDEYNHRNLYHRNPYIQENYGLNSMMNILSSFIVSDNDKLLDGYSIFVQKKLDNCKRRYLASLFGKTDHAHSILSVYDNIHINPNTHPAFSSYQTAIITSKGKLSLIDTSINSTILHNNVKDNFAIEFTLLDVYKSFKDILPFSQEIMSANAMLNTKFYVVYDEFYNYQSKVPKIMYSINSLEEREKRIVQQFVHEKFYPLFSLAYNRSEETWDEYYIHIYMRFKELFYHNAHTVADITFLVMLSHKNSMKIFRKLQLERGDFLSKKCNTKEYLDKFLLYHFINDVSSPKAYNISGPAGLDKFGWNNYDLYSRIISACDKLDFDESLLYKHVKKLT